MKRLNKVVLSLVAVVALAGSSVLFGCGGDGVDDNFENASKSSVGGQTFTFANGEAIDSRLKGKTTALAFNADASRASVSSGGNSAEGTNTFGSCIITIGSSNFLSTAGPQPGQVITLETCEVNADNNTLLIINSNGTSGVSNVGTGATGGTGGIGGT